MLVLALLSIPMSASAQVIEHGVSILTSATAVTPLGCNVSDTGGTEATASCSVMGYAASASAMTSAVSSTGGGTATAFSLASAAVPGSPSNFNSSGIGSSSGVVSWEMQSDHYYSLLTSASGGGEAVLTGPGGNLPPSGIATAEEFYTLRASGFSNALAQDRNGAEEVTDGPRTATAEVTFAAVGSPTLILGTVTSGGVGQPGIFLEALENGIVVAVATSGDDGSYLLRGIPSTVALRVSDPAGVLATEFSGPLAPPINFDVDLGAAIPALPGPFTVVLVIAMALAARRAAGCQS